MTPLSRSQASVALAALVVLFGVSSASAIDKCKVKVDKKTGVINVDASGIGGPLTWGPTSGSETNVFFNAGTCIAGDKAKRCNLASTTTLASKTAPPGCTIYLADGVTPCAAWISGCSPGVRSDASAVVKDANGAVIGTLVDPFAQAAVRTESGVALRLPLNTDGSGFNSIGGLLFLSTNCTGAPVTGIDNQLIKNVTVYGTTGYYGAATTTTQTFQSNLQLGYPYTNQSDCDTFFGVGVTTFVPPNGCCWPQSGTGPLGTAQTIDLSVFAAPFTVAVP